MTIKTETRYAIDPKTAKRLDSQGLREHFHKDGLFSKDEINLICLLYTSPSPRDRTRSRMPSSA